VYLKGKSSSYGGACSASGGDNEAFNSGKKVKEMVRETILT